MRRRPLPTQQTAALVNALKRSLKSRGITYAQLAQALHVSEATVKRCFAQQSLTLRRTEQILAVLDMSFLDVAKLTADPGVDAPMQLRWEQEQALAESPRLFSFFHLLLVGLSLAQIVRKYEISEDEGLRNLRALERLDLIEVLPRNRVHLRTRKHLLWHPQGPLRRAYEQPIREHFLAHAFSGPDEYRKFFPGRLSRASRQILLRKLKRLVAEMDHLSQIDVRHTDEESETSGLFLAFRSFELDHLFSLPRRTTTRGKLA